MKHCIDNIKLFSFIVIYLLVSRLWIEDLQSLFTRLKDELLWTFSHNNYNKKIPIPINAFED